MEFWKISATTLTYHANGKYKTSSSIPKGVYEAFARAVLDTLTDSNVNKYDFDFDSPTTLPDQVYDQIAKRLKPNESFQEIVGTGKERRTYNVRYSNSSYEFLGIWNRSRRCAKVSWQEAYRQERWQLHLLNYSQRR